MSEQSKKKQVLLKFIEGPWELKMKNTFNYTLILHGHGQQAYELTVTGRQAANIIEHFTEGEYTAFGGS